MPRCWTDCGEVLPDAEKAGVILGIEPMHPMYAAERSVVVTLKQANDLAVQLRAPQPAWSSMPFTSGGTPILCMNWNERAGGLRVFMYLTGPCLCPES